MEMKMTGKTQISVRLEGGLGDCLLGNRFVPAIKEIYPDSEITAYIDSEGKTFQKEVLDLCYSDMYKEIKVIQNKKYKEFWVDCQFGCDNYYGALENVPDDIRDEMESDIFYDLHIDSLKWRKYDFDWLRYFYFFPKPQVSKIEAKRAYAVLHLQSATSVGHRLEDWYCKGLVEKLSKEIHCVIIATKEQRQFYSWAEEMDSVRIHIGDMKSVVEQISGAQIMISTDSGFRYLAYGYSIPVLTFSAQCYSPHKVIPSHELRWLIYPYQCYPLNYSFHEVVNAAIKILNDKGCAIFPFIDNFAEQMVDREYTINEEKSILS